MTDTYKDAVTAHRMGRTDEAIALYRRCILESPFKAHAYYLLGCIYMERREFGPAGDCFTNACRLLPENISYLHASAQLSQRQGDTDAAIRKLKAAVELPKAEEAVFRNLGCLYMDAHEFGSALDVFSRAAEKFGTNVYLLKGLRDSASASNNAVALRWAVEKSEEIDCLHGEERYSVRHKLALMESDTAAAIEISRQWLEEFPDSTSALLRQADALSSGDNMEAALRFCLKAVEEHPDNSAMYFKTGCVLNSMDRNIDGMFYLRKAEELEPGNRVNLRNLSNTLMKISDKREYAECIGDSYHYASLAFQTEEKDPSLNINMATVSLSMLRMREGMYYYGRTVDLTPYRDFNRTSRIFHENYVWYRSREDLFKLHTDWGSFIRDRNGPPKTSFANIPDPGKRLKIGFVSADFAYHPVSYFFMSVFKKLTEHFEVYLYSHKAEKDEDPMTEEYRDNAQFFRVIRDLNDVEFQQMVVEDGIDVLFDLSGHTTGNRLRAFSLRMAPVQVSWLGYPNTTGLDVMDYRISDSITEPKGDAESISTEQIVRLPGGFHLYFRPRHGVPAKVLPLPALKKGFVMFGSFNNLKKASPVTFSCWAKVLKAVPGSRMLIKDRNVDSTFNRARVLTMMASYGISPNRIIIKGLQRSNVDHMRAYSHVDVALDCTPYSGTTTTCEALMMGCPVVTLQGDRHASRVTSSLVTHAGHPEWVAKSEEEYVEVAKKLVSDLNRLDEIRNGLRDEFNHCPVCDPDRMDRELSHAIRWMWTQWCDKQRRGMTSAAVSGH